MSAIKIFKSSDLSAKKITGQAGSLIAVLDDVLVNGYGQVSISSISKVDNVATVNTTAAHGLNEGDICRITGSDQSHYNNEFKVHLLSTTSFTIPIPNEAPNVVTGTMTCVKAPLGFSKSFSGVNKAVYRSNDIKSNRHYLRVVDDASGTRGGGEANLSMYEVMTSVDTGDLQIPPTSKLPTNYTLGKSNVSDTSVRQWMIIGNSKTFYMFIYVMADDKFSGSSSIANMVFGDAIAHNPNDVWATMLGAHPATMLTSYQSYNPLFGTFSSPYTPTATSSNTMYTANFMLMRDFNGAKGGRLAQSCGACLSSNQGVNGNVVAIPYPNGPDGGLYLTPMLIIQAEPVSIRGRIPGVYDSLHGRCLGNLDTIDGVTGFPDRQFMMIYGSNHSYSGSIFVDITGPWE